jgi:Protein tyrosine and serine/threonine kinase
LAFQRELKQEEKICMEELQCNIVVMKRSQPKVLRLNLIGSPDKGTHLSASNLHSDPNKSNEKLNANTTKDQRTTICGPAVTPTSSPELETSFTGTEAGTSSVSSSDPATSPFSHCENNLKKEGKTLTKGEGISANFEVTTSDSDSTGSLSPGTISAFKPWMAEILRGGSSTSKRILQTSQSNQIKAEIGSISNRSDSSLSRSIRDAVSLSRNAPPGPPPLCSICQHKAPVFGKPPRWFSYAELELATGGFSKANFLAEGGFGSVHRGVLPDGQAVAVKQHKLASTQGDNEFCSEVEVLSCAQHRNVVMLIGFCVEEKRRLLVYEYICNGSLDSHLYGR